MPLEFDYDTLGEPGEELTGPAPSGQAWKTPPTPDGFPEKPEPASTPGTDEPSLYGEEIDGFKRRRPLVFVPGVMGTALERYSINTKQHKYNVRTVWPPINLATFATDPLHSITGAQVRPSSVSNNPLVSGAYDELIGFLTTELGYRLDLDLFIFGYNWTQSNKISGKKLKGFIDLIFKTAPWNTMPDAEKSVDVICHSMGGIVTRSAMRNWGAKVHRTVYIASPHFGAPKAYAFLHGDTDNVPFLADFILRRYTQLSDGYSTLEKALKDVVGTMISAYELLPDQYYFDRINTIARVVGETPPDVFGRDETYKKNPVTRISNTSLVDEAMGFKAGLGDTPPGLHYVLSSNSEKTPDHVEFSGSSGALDILATTPNGDGTVPKVSGDGNSNYARVFGTHSDVPNMRLTFWHIALFLRMTT